MSGFQSKRAMARDKMAGGDGRFRAIFAGFMKYFLKGYRK